LKHTFAVALASVQMGEGLVRIPLAKLGTWWKGKQRFSITRKDFADLIQHFRAKPNGEVVVDYDHATEFAAGSGEAVPAAGWLKSIEDAPDADGVLYGAVEFTDKARGMVQAREYKYISPVIAWGTRDNQTGEPRGAVLRSVALTNMPVLDSMPAIALSEAGWCEGEPENPAEGKSMAVKKLILADRTAGKVRVILEDDSESVLSVEGFPAEPKVIRLADVGRKEGRYDFSAIETGEGVLVAGDVMHAMKIQQELDDAVKAGKVTPAQRPSIEVLMLSNLEEGRKLIASMGTQVQFGERGIAGGSAEDGDLARVWNDRGQCRLHVRVVDSVLPGVVASNGLWWPKYAPDGGVNRLTPSRLADMGGGATFFSNLVQVEKV
jgi:phage I-like protein